MIDPSDIGWRFYRRLGRRSNPDQRRWAIWMRRDDRYGHTSWHVVDPLTPFRAKCGLMRLEDPTDAIMFAAIDRNACLPCWASLTEQDRKGQPLREHRRWFEGIASQVRP